MQEAHQGQNQSNRFRPGQSGNPAGRETKAARRERVKARALELAAEFGGLDTLTPCEAILIAQAAELLCRRPKNHEDVVRVANSINRLIATVRKRHPVKPAEPDRPAVPSLAECFDLARGK